MRAVEGNYANVADGSSGLRIIDVSDPAAPFEAGFFDTLESARGVYVNGHLAYVADSLYLRVIDVSNPGAPFEEGGFLTNWFVYDVFVQGDFAYLACGSEGLRILYVGSAGDPNEVAHLQTGGLVRDVFVIDDFAYVASDNAGLKIIDVSNPFGPVEVGHFETRDIAHAVFVRDNLAFVADYNCGFQIIRNDLNVSGFEDGILSVHGITLHDPFPNPFNPQTTIAFELPQQEAVSMLVFDVAGRLVRELVGAEDYTAGRHEVVWNGRDDTGRQVASGTYFYRFATGSYSETKPMVLIK